MVTPSVPVSGVIVALFFPTIVSGLVGETVVDPCANDPVTTTKDFEPALALPTPFCKLQNGVAAEPAPVPLSKQVPARFCTYTVSVSIAQRPSMLFRQTPGFPVVPSLAEHWLSAVHAPHRFEVQIGLVATLQSLLDTQVTHWPARVPDDAQTFLLSVRPVHPVAPAVLHPVQAFATQKPLAGSAVHWLSAVHSTHWPAAVPVGAQVVLPSVRAAQPVAPGAVHPVQVLATQKPLLALLQSASALHSTHWPAAVDVAAAQTVLPSVRVEHPVAPVVLQPTQALATQKLFARSVVHWVSATQLTH
jgi:hypothetical protein